MYKLVSFLITSGLAKKAFDYYMKSRRSHRLARDGDALDNQRFDRRDMAVAPRKLPAPMSMR